MRNILFGGKCIDTGEWVKGFYVHQGLDSYIFEQLEVDKGIDLGGYLDACQMTQVIPESVGQYVGDFVLSGENVLKWKPIFEGDIIECYMCDHREDHIPYRHMIEYVWRRGVVSYEEELGEFRVRFFKCGEYDQRQNLWTYGIKRIRILGNSYDNPELLTGRKEKK